VAQTTSYKDLFIFKPSMQPLKKMLLLAKHFFLLNLLKIKNYFVLLQSLNEGFKKPMQV
jgi:hypothetical protein